MVRLVLYTRSVSDIQSEPLFPPGSRAAQRRETPGDRFKEKWLWRILYYRNGLGRLILSSSDADGRAWAKAAAGTVGRRVGVERHRVVTFTTLRARLAVRLAAVQPRFHVQVGGAALAVASQAVKVDRSDACHLEASCHWVGPFHLVGIHQEVTGENWVRDHCLGRDCQETGFHVCSSEDQGDLVGHLARARSASQQ